MRTRQNTAKPVPLLCSRSSFQHLILDQMVPMGWRERPCTFVRVSLGNCAAGCRTVAEDVSKEFGLIPHDQPGGPLLKVCRIFVANTADYAGFADCADS